MDNERELTVTFAIYAVARPSVVSTRLSSVTRVRSAQPVEIFGNVSMQFATWSSVNIHGKFYRDSPRQSLHRGLKRKRGSRI